MDRRSFAGILGALGVAAAATEDKHTRFYAFERYKLKAGTQPSRLHEYFGKLLLPKLDGLWTGPKVYLEAVVAPHTPQVAAIYGFSSLDELWNVRAKILAGATDALGDGSEPPFESLDASLLEAAPYSPEITAATDAKPRIFELRVYHSPTYRQLRALNERFSGPEIKIFHRVGIHPILYASTVFGENIPNLTYLIPFESLAAREKAWTAFAADPEWMKVRKDSIDRAGQISLLQDISLWKAVDYSPIK